MPPPPPLPLRPLGLADGVLCRHHLAPATPLVRRTSLVSRRNRGTERLLLRPSSVMTCSRAAGSRTLESDSARTGSKNLIHHNCKTGSLLRIRSNEHLIPSSWVDIYLYFTWRGERRQVVVNVLSRISSRPRTHPTPLQGARKDAVRMAESVWAEAEFSVQLRDRPW